MSSARVPPSQPATMDGQSTQDARTPRDAKAAETLQVLNAQLARQNHILEMIATGAELQDTLLEIARFVESQFHAIRVSIQLLNEEQTHLLLGAAPHLPYDLCIISNRLEIGPTVGSCGTAAYRREPVFVTDIATDPLWDHYRATALKHGFLACWSIPIRSPLSSGEPERLLGTFAVYATEARMPTSDEMELIGRSQHLAGIAMGLSREKRLREQTEVELRNLFDCSNAGMVEVGADTRLIRVNQALCGMLGYAREELLGRSIREFIPLEDQEHVLKQYNGLIRGDYTSYSGERRYLCKDGSLLHAQIHLSATYLRSRKVHSVVGVLIDVSEQRRLESQVLHSQRMDAVGRLAGGIAHDFNNLLTVIGNYSYLLRSSLRPDDPNLESVLAIQEAGERGARLTRQLLTFSRKSVVTPSLLNLNSIVRDSEMLFRRLIGEDVQLVVSLTPSLPPILADRGQIEQVIMNLVMNARDAMPHGGEVTILTAAVLPAEGEQAGWVELAVRDTGHGMSEEVQSRVFEPFFTTKGVGEGSGLGLAVVHGITSQCNAKVTVESSPNAGSTFRIRFPAIAAEVEPEERPAVVEAKAGHGNILLVEDEDAVRKIVRLTLESHGYEVSEANHAREATRLLEDNDNVYDLLITDIVMPEISGPQLAEMAQRHRPDLKVLMMSGYHDDALHRRGLVIQHRAFLQKPFTPSEILEKVRQLLSA